MKQHLNFTQTRDYYSLKYSFHLIFSKIETVFFSFLCLVLLIVSRVNADFSKDVSAVFISTSLPVVKVVASPFNAAITLLTDFNELVNAKQKNEILRGDLNRLQSLYIKSLNIRQKNEELRRILNFATSKSSDFKVARIIGRTHQVFNQKLFIDIGKNRDIKEGNIATGERGVVGRVFEVGETKSRLILLNDASSRIPIIVSRTRVRGILAGNGSDLMEILYLPKNHNIKEGDLIFTSGDGDSLPPGLLVGVVNKAKQDYVGVEMIENINSMDVATVINY